MTPDEFRALGHQLIEWVAAYRERLPELPVMSPAKPGDVRRHFAPAPPEQGVPLEGLLPQLDAAVLPGVTHWHHPRFFALLPVQRHAALGARRPGHRRPRRAGPELAVEPRRHRARGGGDGLVAPDGRPARRLDRRHPGHGLAPPPSSRCSAPASAPPATVRSAAGSRPSPPPLVVYASAQAHSSVEKAALLAGFGRDNLRLLPTDDAHAMRPDALERRARGPTPPRPSTLRRRRHGRHAPPPPRIDPVGAHRASSRARTALWLHVDAAMAGSAMILPECRWMWDGVERADSLVLNPHKWLGVGFDCSAYYVRDPRAPGPRDVHQPELPADRRRTAR